MRQFKHSQKLNSATTKMLCITSMLLLLTTFNQLGASIPIAALLTISFVAVGCTALLLVLITPISGVTLPDHVDLTFLYTEGQIRNVRRLKYSYMVAIVCLQCIHLAILSLVPSLIFAMAVCLSLMIYLSYWLALHDIRLVATVENYCDW